MGIAHLLKNVKHPDNVIVVGDDLLKKIQAELILMMKDVVSVFDEAGIKWFLSGGSVLGAVRHQGFIPWDDDIDIFMERADFEKFRSVFEEKIGDKYRLRMPGDKGYVLTLPQIQKKNTKVKCIQSVDDCDEGLALDIFILENTYNDPIRRGIHGLFSTYYLFICSAMRMEACKNTILQFSQNDERVKEAVEKRARNAKLFRNHTCEEWHYKAYRYFSHVNKRGKKLVCPSGIKHFFGELYDSTVFDVPSKVDFAGEKWNAPTPPEAYLISRYGEDFMTPPKEEDKEQHVFLELDLGE